MLGVASERVVEGLAHAVLSFGGDRAKTCGLCAGWIAADAEPEPTGAGAHDYRRPNELIAAALDEAKPWLVTGAVSGLDHVLGLIDDRVGLWSVARARDAAWTHATVLWHLHERSILSRAVASSGG